MPYGPQRLVHVVPFTASTILYGFRTNTDAANSTALGHTAVTGAFPTGLVIGANSPKPPRARRITATGVESSFCSVAAKATAIAAGWKVGFGKTRRASSSAKSRTVYITHEGNKIAWKMPQFLYAKISADIAALGILEATGAEKDLVFGASFPRMPRVKRFNFATQESYTTFCDPDALASLPTGWTTVQASEDAQ